MSHRRPSSRMAARVAAAAVALVVVLAGCAAGESAAPTATTGTSIPRSSTAPTTSAAGTSSTTTEATTTTASPTTTPPPNPAWTPDQQAVADAYQHAMAVFDRALKVANPTDPGLAQTMVDPMFKQTRLDLTNMYNRGENARLPDSSVRQEVILSVTIGDVATVAGCSIDDGIVFKVATGEVVNADVVTRRFTATMRVQGGVWKLAERNLTDKQSGAVPCR